MMNIDESNAIIRETVYNNMTNNRSMKILDEYGYFHYLILFDVETSRILFGFKSEDFGKIFDFSGKDCLASDFTGFDYDLDVTTLGIKFSVVLRIDVSRYSRVFEKIKKDLPTSEKETLMMENEKLRNELETFASSTSVLFSKFRILYYSSVIKKMFAEMKEKKSPPTVTLNLNSSNLLYVIPVDNKVILFFGIEFSQKTDIALARVFLQELDDSKRHVKSSVETKYFPDVTRPPSELKELESNPGRFSYLALSHYSNFATKLGSFINFRNYIQYHIHSIKTYLHIRMNRKGQELERKLNETKIISDDYLNSLDSQNFFSNIQKKDEDIKLFTSEFKKVNI